MGSGQRVDRYGVNAGNGFGTGGGLNDVFVRTGGKFAFHDVILGSSQTGNLASQRNELGFDTIESGLFGNQFSTIGVESVYLGLGYFK